MDQGLDWRGLAAAGGRALLIAVPIGLAVFAAFLALNYASLGADRGALAAQIRTAFADRQLEVEDAALFSNTDIGVHQYNDCVILFQALDDRASARERAVSPLAPDLEAGFPCLRLRTFVGGEQPIPSRFYHRYLHGHTTLARLLVPNLGVRGTRELYKLVISALLLIGICYAGAELARGRRGEANAVWLVLFLAFTRFYGLEGFGQSLGHGPADAVLLGFLLFLSRVSASAALSARALWIGAATLGALTMEFEFLTGGLPLGLALIIGATPFAVVSGTDLARATVGAVAAYAGAAVATILGKTVLLIAVFGPSPLVETWRQLLVRTGVAAAPAGQGAASLGDFVRQFWAALDAMALGMQWLVTGALVLAAVGGGWGYCRLRAAVDPRARARAVALVASNFAILFWVVLFWQHAVTHAWFMARILVWPIASGAALFVLALRQAPPAAEA